jgi:multiple sugar transport system permease protein
MTDAVYGSGPVRARNMPSLAWHIVLCVASIAMLYPLIWMLASSFKPEDEIFSSASLWPSSFSLDAYWHGWSGLQVSFGRFFINSAIVSIACVIGNVLTCSLAAYAFARLKFRGRDFWFAMMLGTLMLPYHVTLIPQYVLFLHLDWVNTFLPLVVPKYLAADAFFIFLLTQFFRTLPRELDEAAMIDGCGPWGIYWKIILPLSLPALTTAAIFTFIWTWDDFFGPLVYLTDMANYTVQLGLRSFVDSTGKSDWGALFAMSILTLLPVFAFFLFFQRLLIEGIATTGLRG